MIIGRADLNALTGYSRASAQIRWLRRNGWRFTVSGLGDPIVARSEFERLLVGGARNGGRQEPDIGAINGPKKKA